MKSLEDRRSLLKFGAALPLAIKSLTASAREKTDEAPRRILFICNSLGFYKNYFFPKKRGDLASSDYLSNLNLANKLTLFENLYHPGMETSNHDSEKSFLTGAKNPQAPSFINTISVDQLLARKHGGNTRFPFLALSLYDRGWGCSWNERGTAIPPMHDAQKVYDLLFRNEDASKKRKKLTRDELILDSLKNDLARLTRNGDSTSKISQYRQLVAELENRLNHERFWLETKKPVATETLSRDPRFAFSTKVRNLFELAKFAFQSDSTRIMTISLDWIYGAIKVPGATGGWHSLSHHGGRAGVLKKLSMVERDILRHFNRFLVELDSLPAEKNSKRTLLDQTTVVLGSNFGDASNHTCGRLPIIVAGGNHRHRSHYPLRKPTPLCDLWLEILNQFDIDVPGFGTSERNRNLLGG